MIGWGREGGRVVDTNLLYHLFGLFSLVSKQSEFDVINKSSTGQPQKLNFGRPNGNLAISDFKTLHFKNCFQSTMHFFEITF